LHEDHANAKYLATELAKLSGIAVDLASVQTNIVVVDVSGTGMNGAEFIRRVAEQGLKIGSGFGDMVRFVTHMDVDHRACERTVEIVRSIFRP
jgi:threonine aldolase